MYTAPIASPSGSAPGGSQTATAAKSSTADTVPAPANASTKRGKCSRYSASSGYSQRSTGSSMNAATIVAMAGVTSMGRAYVLR